MWPTETLLPTTCMGDPGGVCCDAGPGAHCTVLWSHPPHSDKTGLPRGAVQSLPHMCLTPMCCTGILCACGGVVPGARFWEAYPTSRLSSYDQCLSLCLPC